MSERPSFPPRGSVEDFYAPGSVPVSGQRPPQAGFPLVQPVQPNAGQPLYPRGYNPHGSFRGAPATPSFMSSAQPEQYAQPRFPVPASSQSWSAQPSTLSASGGQRYHPSAFAQGADDDYMYASASTAASARKKPSFNPAKNPGVPIDQLAQAWWANLETLPPKGLKEGSMRALQEAQARGEVVSPHDAQRIQNDYPRILNRQQEMISCEMGIGLDNWQRKMAPVWQKICVLAAFMQKYPAVDVAEGVSNPLYDSQLPAHCSQWWNSLASKSSDQRDLLGQLFPTQQQEMIAAVIKVPRTVWAWLGKVVNGRELQNQLIQACYRNHVNPQDSYQVDAEDIYSTYATTQTALYASRTKANDDDYMTIGHQLSHDTYFTPASQQQRSHQKPPSEDDDDTYATVADTFSKATVSPRAVKAGSVGDDLCSNPQRFAGDCYQLFTELNHFVSLLSERKSGLLTLGRKQPISERKQSVIQQINAVCTEIHRGLGSKTFEAFVKEVALNPTGNGPQSLVHFLNAKPEYLKQLVDTFKEAVALLQEKGKINPLDYTQSMELVSKIEAALQQHVPHLYSA